MFTAIQHYIYVRIRKRKKVIYVYIAIYRFCCFAVSVIMKGKIMKLRIVGGVDNGGGPGSGRYKRKKDAPKYQTPLVQAADPSNIDASVNSKIIAFGKELIKFDMKRWDDPELLEKRFYEYLDLCDKYEVKLMVSSMVQAFGMNRKVLWGIATRNDHYKHSVNGKAATSSMNLKNVRKSFANDETSIVISAGVAKFNANTFVVNSEKFKVTKTGVITSTAGKIGGFSISDNAIYIVKMKLDSDGLTLKNGSYTVGNIGTYELSDDASRKGLSEYMSVRDDLVKKYGEPETDENGNATGSISISVKSPKFGDFSDELSRYVTIEHEPKLFTLPIKEAIGKLSGTEIPELEWMFDEESEKTHSA